GVVKVIGKVLFVLLLVTSSNDAFAQGVVYFENDVIPSPPDRHVRDAFGQPLSGTNFIAQLLYQDNTGTWVADPTIARFFTSAANAGFWNGGNRTLVNAGSSAPGVYAPINMQVRAWDAGFGGTTQ